LACSSVRAIKAIEFRYSASNDLAYLFEDFRLMCNDAIRIALKEQPKTRFALQKLAYSRLKEYGLHTHYILSACEVAFAAYRNKNRKKSNPHVKRAFLKLDNQSYVLNHLILRIPTTPRNFIYLILQGSKHHLSHVDDPTLRKGSATILANRAVIIAFSKEVVEIEPLGNIGVDVNEKNVTMSDTLGSTRVFDTSDLADIKERYKAIRSKIGSRTGRDCRIAKGLYSKYGKRERDRTRQRLNIISKTIVEHAYRSKLRIVMENLIGIRNLYRKGNGQGTLYRGRMNSWTFREIQRQVEYKAKWEGLSIVYVNPHYTTRNCSKCRSSQKFEGRAVICSSCGKIEDRDVNASRNIMMACAVPQVRPSR
jgi:putative transposase